MRQAVLAGVALMLLAAGCSEPAERILVQAWIGTSTSGGVDSPLNLETRSSESGRVEGDYQVSGAYAGSLEGTMSGESLTATLNPGSAGTVCTYEFAGTLTADSLTGSFAPLDCPGGLPGTWDLVLGE